MRNNNIIIRCFVNPLKSLFAEKFNEDISKGLIVVRSLDSRNLNSPSLKMHRINWINFRLLTGSRHSFTNLTILFFDYMSTHYIIIIQVVLPCYKLNFQVRRHFPKKIHMSLKVALCQKELNDFTLPKIDAKKPS